MTKKLSEKARVSLEEIRRHLADGFTGQIVLNCTEGGVSNIDFTKRIRPKDLLDKEPRG